jgi:predicted GNAT family N-acyltransferase
VARLATAVQMSLDRLAYLRPPPRAAKGPAAEEIVVRRIQTEDEMRKSFAFRYNVYRTMCYLDRRLEDYPKELEVDWFDKHSYHIGAFHDGHLVGTARLITTGPIDKEHGRMVDGIVDQETFLQNLIDNGAVQAQLPVLQSQRLIAPMAEAIRRNLVIGEVSRVVVHRDYRGCGLSGRLMNHLLRVAEEREIAELLLECLPIHARVYERHEFETMPHVRGTVYMIGRTMIVMHRALVTPSVFRPPTPPDTGAPSMAVSPNPTKPSPKRASVKTNPTQTATQPIRPSQSKKWKPRQP